MSGLMRPWQVAVLLIVASAASAAGGFWLGFREAWTLSAAADLMPRAARSVKHLEAIHAGNLRPVVLGLEFDVDNALVWGYEVMNHPLRELWQPLWAIDVYPGYERYLGELADYRLGHPSSTRADMFASAPDGVRTCRMRCATSAATRAKWPRGATRWCAATRPTGRRNNALHLSHPYGTPIRLFPTHAS
jgi:hypothetical protein